MTATRTKTSKHTFRPLWASTTCSENESFEPLSSADDADDAEDDVDDDDASSLPLLLLLPPPVLLDRTDCCADPLLSALVVLSVLSSRVAVPVPVAAPVAVPVAVPIAVPDADPAVAVVALVKSDEINDDGTSKRRLMAQKTFSIELRSSTLKKVVPSSINWSTLVFNRFSNRALASRNRPSIRTRHIGAGQTRKSIWWGMPC
jgi:hypothetical protein